MPKIPSVVRSTDEITLFDEFRTKFPKPRIFKKAQVKRLVKGPLEYKFAVSKEYIVAETKGIEIFLSVLLKKAVFFQVQQKKKTLSQEHVILALQALGYDAWIPPTTKDLKRQKSIQDKKVKEDFNNLVFGETTQGRRRRSSSSSKKMKRRTTKSLKPKRKSK